ncbi:MAG: hypothetical protein GC159_08915 [Phycisphaera sp.]|nr:hypothetical protein [Phycisphaera sp.]
MRIVTEIEIAAPTALIFKWISDGDHVCRWVEALKAEKLVEAVDGRVGTTFKRLYREDGKSFEMDGEVLAWEQDQRVAVLLRGERFEMELEMTIEPCDGLNRRVTRVAEVRMFGLAGVMGGLLGGAMRRKATAQAEADLRRLQALCEAEAVAR